MKTLFSSQFAVCLAVGVVLAQAPRTEFEVATVTLLPPLPVSTPLLTINLGAYRNGTLTMNNVTLSEALRFAYELTSDERWQRRSQCGHRHDRHDDDSEGDGVGWFHAEYQRLGKSAQTARANQAEPRSNASKEDPRPAFGPPSCSRWPFRYWR